MTYSLGYEIQVSPVAHLLSRFHKSNLLRRGHHCLEREADSAFEQLMADEVCNDCSVVGIYIHASEFDFLAYEC